MVLRGATSQWKRSRGDRRPIGPASAPPAQISGMLARLVRTASRSTVAVQRQQARLVQLDARRQEIELRAGHDHARIDELLALDARHYAHDRVVIRA